MGRRRCWYGGDRKLTGTELLLIGLYLVSFVFYVYCYLVLIPKFSAIEWERRFKTQESQESLIEILMGPTNEGVIPLIVGSTAETIKKMMQGYEGKSKQQIGKMFGLDQADELEESLQDLPAYLRFPARGILEKVMKQANLNAENGGEGGVDSDSSGEFPSMGGLWKR